MSRLATIALSALLLLIVVSYPQAENRAGTDQDEVSRGNREFAWALYNRLREREGNLCFSPFGVSEALALASAGARGQTAEVVTQALHLPSNREQLHPAFAVLVRNLESGSRSHTTELQLANAVWAHRGDDFRREFLAIARDNYRADLGQVDFAGDPAGTCKLVNRWADQRTGGKVKDLLRPADLAPDTRLLLTNAVYFKARWATEFDGHATRPEEFHADAGRKNKVPTMHRRASLNHFAGDGLQLLEVPYQGDRMSLLVLLPRKLDGLAEMERGLTADRVEGWRRKLKAQVVDLSLPRFRTESRFELGEELAELGMGPAFTPGQADFSGLTGRKDWHLGGVVHGTFVELNEKGTEAAAATAVGVPRSVALLPEGSPVVFRADHPFVFVIYDHPTGSILFLGRVTQP